MQTQERMEVLRKALDVPPIGDDDPGSMARPLENKVPPMTTVPVTTPALTERIGQVYKFCRTPLVTGILTFIVAFVILLVMKPGFFGSDVVNDAGEKSRTANLRACLVCAGIAGGLVAGVPYFLRWRANVNDVKLVAERK
jgi:hypothetical protein